MSPTSFATKLLQRVADWLPKNENNRHVLLDVKNTVTAPYLEDFRQLFADDIRIEFAKVTGKYQKKEDRLASLSMVHCPEVGFHAAHIIPWDLVVMADHPLHAIGNPGRFPVLRISHGIGGKTVDGHDYFYGPRLYMRDGKLRYTRIFEASSQRHAQFVVGNSLLQSAVRIVGDLRIDQLRNATRITTPVSGAKPRVVIACSWNPQNLLEKHGHCLLGQANILRSFYDVVVRPHPHFFKTESAPVWRQYFADIIQAGFTLSQPPEELCGLLASASVVICDDLSSVALYAVALGRPVLLCPSGSSQVSAESFLGRLAGIVPNLITFENLVSQLHLAMDTPLSSECCSLAQEINSRPGQAAALMRSEVYDLLHLMPQARVSAPCATEPAALAPGRVA